MCLNFCLYFFFFFNDTATTEIYTLSLHDALPIFGRDDDAEKQYKLFEAIGKISVYSRQQALILRSEEHTSELQSRQYLVCRLLLEKKKKTQEHKDKNKSVLLSRRHEQR